MIIEPDIHREFSRIHFDNRAQLEFVSDCFDHCRINDLSLAGMFVEGDFSQQVQVGRCCNIDFVQEGLSRDLNLHALARVVRKDDHGVAVKFVSMTSDSYMFLQASLLGETDLTVNEKILAEQCPFQVTDDVL